MSSSQKPNLNELTRQFESGAAVAWLAVAQIDWVLEEAIDEFFVVSATERHNLLFGGSAPLATLGIFGSVTQGDLVDIAHVRNIFAHARTHSSAGRDPCLCSHRSAEARRVLPRIPQAGCFKKLGGRRAFQHTG